MRILREFHPLPKPDQFLASLMPTVDSGKSRGQKILPLDYFHYIIRVVMLQQKALWNQQCSRALQKTMTSILGGLDGGLCLMDDVLVFTKDKMMEDSSKLLKPPE